MAFGKHWEWRGFGEISPGLRTRLESLPLKFPTSQELTDEYLWASGSPVNVKLRFSDLKFKRLCERSRGLELWLEDPDENYRLPIAQEVLAKLALDLGVVLPEATQRSRAPRLLDRVELLDLLGRASPEVRLVSVKKVRWQREWRLGGSSDALPVTVEVAQILLPESTWSVGIEGPDPGRVTSALGALGLDGALRKLNYLEALGVWAGGRSLAS